MDHPICPACDAPNVVVRVRLGARGGSDLMWGACPACGWESDLAVRIPLKPYPTMRGAQIVPRVGAVA